MVLRLLREIQPVGCELPLGICVTADEHLLGCGSRTGCLHERHRCELCYQHFGFKILLFHKTIYYLIIYHLPFIWLFSHFPISLP